MLWLLTEKPRACKGIKDRDYVEALLAWTSCLKNKQPVHMEQSFGPFLWDEELVELGATLMGIHTMVGVVHLLCQI